MKLFPSELTGTGHIYRRAYSAASSHFRSPQIISRYGYNHQSSCNSSFVINQSNSRFIGACQGWHNVGFQRNIVTYSKRGKRKSVKAVVKRFKRLGSGALKRWRSGKNHNMRKKSTNQKRRLRKPVIVKGRQLRKLNKMLSGW